MLSERRSKRRGTSGVRVLVTLLGFIWFLSGCDSGGSSGSLSAPPEPALPAPQLEQAAVRNLLDLQRTAVLQEDIDRLQALLHEDGGTFGDGTFLAFMADTFRRVAVLDLQHTEVTLQLTHEPFTATFWETLSVEDPMTLEQRTHSARTIWRLVTQIEASGTVTILIGAVTQTGPQFEVMTRGQVQAGVPVAVEVRETSGTFAVASVEVEVPDTGVRTSPRAEGSRFVGSFTPPGHSQPKALQVHIRDAQGKTITVTHRYRLRVPGDGAVERVDGADGARLFALSVAPDGTVWAGGDSIFFGTAGTLIQVAADGQTVLFIGQPFLASLPAEATARIEDLALDQLGRVHALFIARVGDPEGVTTTGVVGNGDVVLDPQQPDLFCQTVNAFVRDPQTGEPQFDPAYPFRVPKPQTGQLLPSPSTRVRAAEDGDVWLFGSDGGVARVEDAFRDGRCPAGQVDVRYDPVYRRGESGLLSNTVPALEVGRDGALWFGTAFGLTRLLQGQFIPVPFDPALSLRGNVATLEAFFREVAEAIFAARPVSAVSIGGVSFVNAFGSPLIKEDLIFSLAEDGRGRLWVGTLGGGIRRIEVIDGVPRQTLHLTRADGLGSNLIFGLAVGPDGVVWAATEEGVSRLQELNGVITMTNFSASDGLALPVRDVAVAGDGTVWLASDGGLFRLTTAVGVLRGVVQDAAGRPVVGAEVRLLGTPFRTVTDAEGRFVLANLPPGEYQLLIDGSLAVGGPFTAVVGEVEVAVAEQTLPPVGVVPRPPAARLVIVGGDAQTGLVGQPLPTPLEVAVQEAAGRGIAGVAVTFIVAEGSGDLASEVVVTEADGLARNTVAITAAGTLQVVASTEGTAPVVFTLTGVGEGVSGGPVKPRLIPVSGNNQSADPGQALPEPLVVRLEDQFGKPIVGQSVTAEIVQGEGTLTSNEGSGLTVNATTDAQGEARFQLQVGDSTEDIVVRVSALGQSVQFLAIVGAVDTPDLPFDVAVMGNVVYIADRSGLQIIDVSDPSHPSQLATVDLEGAVERLALDDRRLYVATTSPHRVYIFDITNPSSPREQGTVNLPARVQNQRIRGVAVQGGFAYVVTIQPTRGLGTLQVLDISDPSQARVVGSSSEPDRPTDVAVSGTFAYVPDEASGLLVFDIGDPRRPTQVGRVSDPNPSDTTLTGFLSGIAVAGNFAYVVETQCESGQDCNATTARNFFTVLDLSNPMAPRRRGTVQTSVVFLLVPSPIALAGQFAYLVQGPLGLQAIDISNPDAPQPVGRIDTPSLALNVATAGQFIYVTDEIFGLQVIRGPGEAASDADGDGVIDFFDVFPTDPREALDTDGDGIGDKADPDDDNDGFTDEEEVQASSPTDPKDPRLFPVRLPPPNASTLIVDAASPVPARERNGTPEAPYRSITEAVRVLQGNTLPSVNTLQVRSGTYSFTATQEIFPLRFEGLSNLTLQGAGWEATVIDAEFTGEVINLSFSSQMIIEGFTITHGASGLFANEVKMVTIRQNRIIENAFEGVELGINSDQRNIIIENIIERNSFNGISIFDRSEAMVLENFISRNVQNGVFIENKSTANITINTIMDNGRHGILIEDSIATVGENYIQRNGRDGIPVISGATAEIIANTITGNKESGVVVDLTAEVTVTQNVIGDNDEGGIIILNNSSGELTANTVTGNERFGIVLLEGSRATLTNNTVENNRGGGVRVGISDRHPDHSFAAISGGAINQNGGHGIALFNVSTADIGLTGDILTIARSGGAGIFVNEDGSLARIDRTRLIFDGNAGGEIVGPIIDLTPSAQ